MEIFKSRRAWLAILDCVGIIGGIILQSNFVQYRDIIIAVVAALQPVVLLILSQFTVDDTVAKVADLTAKGLIE
jgi:hypothetical protein